MTADRLALLKSAEQSWIPSRWLDPTATWSLPCGATNTPNLQSSPPTSSRWSLEDLALMHVRRVLYPVVADTRPSHPGRAAGFCAFPRQGHRSRGACVGVFRSCPGARTFLSPLAEDIHRRLSNCFRRRFWRHFGPLLGEISRTGSRGHSRYRQQQRRGPPGEPHFLRRFLGRWRHSPSLRRSSKPFPSGTLGSANTSWSESVAPA